MEAGGSGGWAPEAILGAEEAFLGESRGGGGYSGGRRPSVSDPDSSSFLRTLFTVRAIETMRSISVYLHLHQHVNLETDSNKQKIQNKLHRKIHPNSRIFKIGI